jgi:hypothetical protein
MNQPAEFGGVPVAPNRCEITARILSKQQDGNFPDKWLYDIEIIETRDKEGPNFARAGQAAKAFSFEAPDQVSIGSSIAAEAEYIGGSRSGQFLLKHVTTTSAG